MKRGTLRECDGIDTACSRKDGYLFFGGTIIYLLVPGLKDRSTRIVIGLELEITIWLESHWKMGRLGYQLGLLNGLALQTHL